MKLSIRQPTTLGWALALLLAAMLLSASGARAAANRGAVLVRDINPGRSDSSGSKGGRLTNVSGTLYVSVDDGKHGYELWRSDGTEAGTTLVKDLNPGAADNYLRVLNDANGILYLSANGGPNGTELWRSDGTEAGTTLVKQIMGGIFPPIVVKGRVLYLGAGSGLWRSDGTPQGTTLVRGGRSGRSFSVESLTLANGTLYFVGTDKRHGRELWQSDGTRAGTKIVRNIRRGSASSRPNRLTAVGGSLFFTAKDRSHGRELWRAGPKPCKTAKGKCKKG